MKKMKNAAKYKEIEVMIECAAGTGFTYTLNSHANKEHQFSDIYGAITEMMPRAIASMGSPFKGAVLKIKEPQFEYWIVVDTTPENELKWTIRNHSQDGTNPVIRAMFEQMGEFFKARSLFKSKHLIH